MKQAINILIAYLTCTDPVMQTKWANILASYFHKDEGQIVKEIVANGNDWDITLIDGDGNETTTTINQYQEPANFAISKITDLQTALDGLVAKVVGKGLSTEDFTNAFKIKLEGLNNYVHPTTHTIGEVDGLQTLLDGIATNITTLNGLISVMNQQQFLIWNGYRLYKNAGNSQSYPEVGEEIMGRGDGRFENGEWVHGEATVDNPIDDNNFNLYTSYP